MRLIDADELMEHAWRDKLDSRELIAKMIDNAPTVKEIPTKIPINIFEQLLSQKPKTWHWVPVSERLPEEGKLILLCFRSAKDTPHWRIQVGYLGRHDVEDCFLEKIGVVPVWYTDKFYWSFDKVVAWMSLPESYKAEREGKNE